jgi:hypothetical protein
MPGLFHEQVKREIINLRRVVKGSKLGRHISENILIPILEQIDPIVDEILDWVGWYLQQEIREVLTTARPSNFVYTVYFVDEGAYQKYTKVGEYRSSQRGGPPISENIDDPEIPQSGNLLKSITYEVRGSNVILGIEDNPTPYNVWYNPDWPGKLFVSKGEGRSASVYGAVLDSPKYDHYRPYFTSTIRQMKGKLKKQFREHFKREINKVTRRTSVKRAIEIHFRWIES